jgi:nucleoside-diphosphate-sugar epimerase
VDIFHHAVKAEPFTCFLKDDTALPMMYMHDAIRATLELMDAPKDQVLVRTSYNLGALSFTPKEIYEQIEKEIPGFQIRYSPDFRQQIAESWPNSVDDTQAKKDWGWTPAYDLEKMVSEMLSKLSVYQ